MLFVGVVVVVVVAVPHWWDFIRWDIGSCIVPFIFVTLCSSNRRKKTLIKAMDLMRRGYLLTTVHGGDSNREPCVSKTSLIPLSHSSVLVSPFRMTTFPSPFIGNVFDV